MGTEIKLCFLYFMLVNKLKKNEKERKTKLPSVMCKRKNHNLVRCQSTVREAWVRFPAGPTLKVLK